jgi:non-ribosomal peptide synthetase component E (peptide arylation enzyme)
LHTLLSRHPNVAIVAVVGVKDRALDEKRVCACVVFKPEQTVTLSERYDYLRAKDGAAYTFPKALRVLPALSRNPLGKVLKSALREMSPGA